MAKRDVARAFKWHSVALEDVPEFGATLPGASVGVEGRVILIHAVLVFGWAGSPGEYMSFAQIWEMEGKDCDALEAAKNYLLEALNRAQKQELCGKKHGAELCKRLNRLVFNK